MYQYEHQQTKFSPAIFVAEATKPFGSQKCKPQIDSSQGSGT